MADDSIVVVLMTASSEDEAHRLGRVLVDERLAACVNVLGPMRSIFRWAGAVQEEREHLLIAKARRADVERLTARVQALHSYEVPEVLALDVAAGAAPYLAWVRESTTRGAVD
ncbi:MAG TPA: divalent-cation tolerance protein CutA [Candidatus Limnocylindria bacterium]|nr:divalent-cation tolerance protein CutA [Candidatus Limnocylindria bacterium]